MNLLLILCITPLLLFLVVVDFKDSNDDDDDGDDDDTLSPLRDNGDNWLNFVSTSSSDITYVVVGNLSLA